MKTADLIDQLSSSAGPLRLRPVWKRWLATLAWTAVLSGGVFFFFHLRPDLGGEMLELPFVLGGSALLLSWVLSSWALSLLMTPGREARAVLGAAVAAVGLLAALFLVQAFGLGPETPMGAGLRATGIRCTSDVLLISLLPVAVTLYRLRKGAPTRLALTGIVAGVVCASLGAFALQFSCANGHPIHLLVWHLVLPFALLGGAGAWAARRFLRW